MRAPADLHPLADDLVAAAAGDPPLDPDRGVGGCRWWAGEAGAAQPGPVGGWQGEREGAPQHPVDDDVDQLRGGLLDDAVMATGTQFESRPPCGSVIHWPSRSAVRVADNHNRAGRVLHAVLAD